MISLDGVRLRCLAFDFDGVLCDSARECFLNTVATLERPRAPLAHVEQAFLLSRWLVRPPWQFGVLLPLLETLAEAGITDPASLAEEARARFPGEVERWPGDPPAFEAAFFERRSRARAQDPGAWFRLNPPFPPAVKLLERFLAGAEAGIVSTKDEAAIGAWLKNAGIPVPADRIRGAQAVGRLGKDGVMRELAREGGWTEREVGLIDDNLENLVASHRLGFPCWVAEWGYVIPGSLAEASSLGVRRLSLASVSRWLETSEGKSA